MVIILIILIIKVKQLVHLQINHLKDHFIIMVFITIIILMVKYFRVYQDHFIIQLVSIIKLSLLIFILTS